MSSTVPPGHAFGFQVKVIPIKVDRDGTDIAPTITGGPSIWNVEIDALDVKCPGPITVSDQHGNVLETFAISPCP